MNGTGLLGQAARRGHIPQLVSGFGAVDELARLIGHDVAGVLVVASDRAVRSTDALSRLLARGATGHHRITPNPSLELTVQLAGRIDRLRPRTIVAVGGGSTLDLAKAARLLPVHAEAARSTIDGDTAGLRADPARLIAVPTTAGTGSEMTPFATVYDEGRKLSFDYPTCRADLAVLDPALSRSCPASASVPAYLDALAHAIESYWSRRATVRSRVYAAAAMDALVTLAPSCNAREQRDDRCARALLVASALAGIAISMTRTTAPHAFSYWLTSRRGLPHGFACALSLWWLADYNWDARPRGDTDVERVLRRVGAHPDRAFFSPVGVLRRVVLRAIEHELFRPPELSEAERRDYLKAGLGVHGRTENNPVRLGEGDLSVRIAFPPLSRTDVGALR